MKKILAVSLSIFFSLLIFGASPVSAQPTTGSCGTLECPVGYSKESLGGSLSVCQCVANDDIFGTIEPPAGVEKYDAASGGKSGLILFLSNLIRIGTVVAGIWVMVNFILAGWTYITSSGDAKAHGDASNKMTYSLIGIAIIVGAYTLAAVIGLVIFGDAGYILNPQFTGVGGV